MPLPETMRRIANLALSVVATLAVILVAVFFWSHTDDPQVSAALHNIGAGQNTTSEIRAINDSLEAERRDLKMLSYQFFARASRLRAVQEDTTLILRNNAEPAERKATKAGTEASQLKKTADAGSADVQKSLQQERDRATRLEQDLAAARRDVETQTALATKAGAEASQLKKTADAGSAELRKSLQQEHDRASRLEQDLALARSNASAPSIIAGGQISKQHEAEAAKPVAVQQAAVADARVAAQPKAKDDAEVARLMAYAHVLLGRGDIGSARIVLQRAAEMGDAQANFTLAETYDSLILSKWGTYGTHGDAKKALDLYARAFAGGIKEAKGRSDALRQ